MNECNAKVKKWSDSEKHSFIQDVEVIMHKLNLSVEANEVFSSSHVQELMRQHYEWLKRSWLPTKEQYLGLAELYQTPEFKKFFDSRYPQLLTFMVAAMIVFAEQSL